MIFENIFAVFIKNAHINNVEGTAVSLRLDADGLLDLRRENVTARAAYEAVDQSV